MGEIADMMLDGTMCQCCGEWMHDGEDGPGYPQTCEGCGGGYDIPRSKRSKRARKRKNTLRNRSLRAQQANTEGWRKCSPHHFQKRIGETLIDWWPGTRKMMTTTKTPTGSVRDVRAQMDEELVLKATSQLEKGC